MDEVKWYENCTLDSIKNIIKDNINTASRSFVAIGYYLKNVRDRKLYQQDGYQNIWEFAQDEFGISQSWASRYMSINDRFSKDGNSPMIQDEFQGFDKSKLSEMLTLTDEQLKQVTLTTTVAQIKDIKKSYATSHKTKSKEKDSSVPVEEELEPEFLELDCLNDEEGWHKEQIQESSSSGKCIHRSTYNCTLPETAKITTLDGEKCSASCCWECIKHGECKIECNSSAHRPAGDEKPSILEHNEKKKLDIPTFELNGKAYGATRSTIIESLVAEMVEMDMDIADIDGICCHAFGFNFYAYNMCTGYITIENKDEEPVFSTSVERFKGEYEWHKARLATLSQEALGDDEEPESVNDVDEDDKCSRCQLNGNTEAGILECHPEKGEHKCWIDYDNPDKYEQVETVEADVIHTEPDQDNEPMVKKMARFAMEWFEQGDYPSTDFYLFQARKDLADNYEYDRSFYPDYFNDNRMPQPKLPKLKNNDQRKEWIDNYETWPVWIDIPQTGERYYRYDFSNDTSFVIRVSLQHAYKGYERTKDIKYTHEEYFLLGVKNKWIPGMPTFVESSTNKSAMVEHLKEIQKKGG